MELAAYVKQCSGQSLWKHELWRHTSGVIHLHLSRVVRFSARSRVSADLCQNSLQTESCIIFFGCPSSKWTISSSVSVNSGTRCSCISTTAKQSRQTVLNTRLCIFCVPFFRSVAQTFSISFLSLFPNCKCIMQLNS